MGWGWGTNKQVITWSAGARKVLVKTSFSAKANQTFIVREGLEADVKQENFVAPHIPSSIQSFNKNMIMSSPCLSLQGISWSSDLYIHTKGMALDSYLREWWCGFTEPGPASRLLIYCSLWLFTPPLTGWSPVHPSGTCKEAFLLRLTPPVTSQSPQ